MIALTILSLILLIAIIVFLAWKRANNDWIAIAISFFALVFSLLSAFKGDLLPPNLVLTGDSIILVATDFHDPKSDIPIAIPLGFLNRGYSEGIVELISIKSKNLTDGSERLLTPICEIDLPSLIQKARILRAENIIGEFAPFVILPKSFINKNFVFTQDDPAKVQIWTPGKYRFDIYVKIVGSSKPQLLKSIILTINQNVFTNYYNGGTQALR